jgi:hypothetical protein
MNSSRFVDSLKWYAALAVLAILAGCASGPKIVDHAFTFDVYTDSPEVELLDYRYGDSDLPGTSNPSRLREKGRAPLNININGPMRQGESLYVKWRLKATGDMYEDTVDLRSRLPSDITGQRIYFMIKGPQLYVYLIPASSRKRPAGVPPAGPRAYQDLDVRTIYPDRPRT